MSLLGTSIQHLVGTQHKSGWRKYLAFVGPAYVISAGYMDPGNWATDLAGGSQFGYRLIWVLFISNLMALLLQSLSTRLGIVQGLDLAQATKNAYPPLVNICLYVMAEIAIIACDLAEIVGMSIGLQLLFKLPLIWGVCITILDTFLLLFLFKKGIRRLEGFVISMICVIGISFLIEILLVQPELSAILKGFQPRNLSGQELYIAIGIIGATVMPHNLYLHAALVQTRKISRSVAGIKSALKMNLLDTALALNLAFLVNAALLILAAAAFFKNQYYNVSEIQDAYYLLQDILGDLAPGLFAVALIASGQSSTVAGTLAGQIIMEGHLNLRIQAWLRRLLTRLLAIVPAVLVIIYFGDKALGDLLVLSQVILSLQLGFAIIPLIHFNADPKKMGVFCIKKWTKIASWTAAALIISMNVKLTVEAIIKWIHAAPSAAIWIYTVVLPIIVGIALLLLYVLLQPFLFKRQQHASSIPHGKAMPLQEPPPVAYRCIGIAIDFSKNDQTVIRHALMQGGKQAHYILIHIVETAGAQYHGKNVLDHETRSDQLNLDHYVQNLAMMGYQASTSIGYAQVATSIAEIVALKKIDFLVMGAHGHRRLKDWILGTTVEALRHKLAIPVLIVQTQQD